MEEFERGEDEGEECDKNSVSNDGMGLVHGIIYGMAEVVGFFVV